MSFHEVQFPVEISYGSAGGPGFNTTIVETDSGSEERVSRWSTARRRYDAAQQDKSKIDMAALITFYIARKGSAFGFRYKDWHDFTSRSDHKSTPTNVDVQIGVGNASTTQFQLVKKYVSGSSTEVRNIKKPVSGTTVIAFDGVNQSSGWSVSTSTGIVTFTAAPGSGVVITAGFEFDVPVRFGKELDRTFSVTYDSFDAESADSIPMVEIIDETEVVNEFFYGGAKAYGSISNSISLSLQDGRVVTVNPQVAGLKINLPNPVTGGIPKGGPIFFITNGGPQAIELTSHAGATVMVIPNGTSITVNLGEDSSGNKLWTAF